MTKENTLIEDFFPINPINEIAEKESKAKRYYRPVYTMHKWWARRLGSVFRSIIIYSLIKKDEDISKYLVDEESEKNDQLKLSFEDIEEEVDSEKLWRKLYLNDLNLNKTILDPFMGGGTTIVEGLRLGCNVIGCDLNPVAWFTVKKEIEPVDIDELEKAFKKLEEEVAPEILKYYKTDCAECGHKADAMYYFWVKELRCLNCGEKVSLYKDYKLAKTRSKKNEGYWVICPDCGEVFVSDNYKEENKCLACGFRFNPDKDGNTSGKYFTCPHCGQKQEIIEVISEQGKPSERLYAVEYYCENCDVNNIGNKVNGKSYKKADDYDLKLYKEAAIEYEGRKDELPIPQQKIPEGYNTRQILNYGYKYWKDMFTKRQLLCHGKFLRYLKNNIYDLNIKELFLLAFSQSLDSNNKISNYDSTKNHIKNMFSHHAFIPATDFCENNAFGAKQGARTLKGFLENIISAKKYCIEPFEKFREKGKTLKKQMKNSVNSSISLDYKEFKNYRNVLLLNHTSEDLSEIPDKSVDAVITDPPYYDNVMYSELSDFFYVWLREMLKNEYDNFQSELTPKYSEIVKNYVQGKTEEDYIKGLTRVFLESRKKLKDEGIMTFTFHHQNNKAWGAVLKAVLDAGLYVTAIYPIQSEMSTSMHIQNKANVEYDMIVVCRKRLKTSKEKSWNRLKDKLSFQIGDIITDLEKKDKDLSMGDVFVIALGKCLEVYSQHYPNVMEDGKMVSVEKAISDVQRIIDSEIAYERLQDLISQFDEVSAIYLAFLMGKGKEISYSSLNKELSSRNIDINKLIDARVVEKNGSMLRVLEPEERYEYLKNITPRLAIDEADYLYNLVKEDIVKQAQRAVTERAYKFLKKQLENGRGVKKVIKTALKLAETEL